MPGESDKKTWEKERRGRIKEAFITLEKLLPSYDPSAVSTRINTLNKSIEYIQEMQNRVDELLKPNNKINTEVLQLKKLQDRIKRLLSRNELLSSLLREAKISIPNQGCTLKTFKYGYKWSGKISEKMAMSVQKKAVIQNEKENNSDKRELLKRSKPNKKIRNKLNSSSLVPKHRKSIVNRYENSNGINMKKKFSYPVSTNCFIIYTQSCNTQPCYLVTNAPSNNFASLSQTGISKDNKNKNSVKSNTNDREEKNTHNNQFSSNVGKKVKRKAANESSITPNFVDFSFLSVPGNINSPLLPDDFHSHSTFLPPPLTQPQLYPCKNPIYSTKQSSTNSVGPLLPLPPIPSVTRTGVPHPEVSPSLNSGGTSLTNFNLSTIFPEINKGSINEIYSDNRVKEHPATTHYPNSSVPFNSNSKPIFSYANCQTTQSYGTNNT